MSIWTKTLLPNVERPRVFDSVVVGVDGSGEAVEAARQAALLAGTRAPLTLLAAWLEPVPPDVPLARTQPYYDEAELRRTAEDALATAQASDPALADAATKVVHGLAWQAVLEEIERGRHTLVAVGAHGGSRALGIITASTATELIHKAPCSVLVARPASSPSVGRIAVGVDGSHQSAAAFAVAEELAERLDAELWAIIAHKGDLAVDGVAAIVGAHRREDPPDEPVPALLAAAADADLLVLGSRGLRGLKALGSVSEQVAHRARCSTLVVRTAAPDVTAGLR